MSRFTSLALACLLALAITAAVSACGSDPATTEQAPESAVPESAETISEFADRFEAAAAAVVKGDCKAVDEFNRGSSFPLPCPYDGKGLRRRHRDRVGGVRHRRGGRLHLRALARGRDSGRRVARGRPLSADPEPRAELAGLRRRAGRDRARGDRGSRSGRRDFVDAVREQDCDTYFQLALTPTQDKEKECRLEFSPKAEISPDLAANPDATPEAVGETEAFGLYGLETDGNYRTILAFRNTGPGDEITHDDGYRIVTFRATN